MAFLETPCAPPPPPYTVTPNATVLPPLAPSSPSDVAPAPPAPTVTAYVPAGMVALVTYAAPPAPPPPHPAYAPPPPPAISKISAPASAVGNVSVVGVPLVRMHVYVAPLSVRVASAAEFDVMVAMTGATPGAAVRNHEPTVPTGDVTSA
jgi:hypothetical protein